MRSFVLLLAFAAIAIMISPGSASAQEESPIQLSLFNPVQLVPETKGVSAIRLNLIYTKNASMSGFDFGLVNKTTGDGVGLMWTGVGMTDGNFTGWQGSMVGIVGGNFVGWQEGLVNICDGRFKGLQTALIYNTTNHCKGLQFALVNSTETMEGIQIGLLNFIKKGGAFAWFPIVNWSF
jgi:hypothetical protein